MANVKDFCRQTDWVKTICPSLLMQGHNTVVVFHQKSKKHYSKYSTSKHLENGSFSHKSLYHNLKLLTIYRTISIITTLRKTP